jgi:hypothetical protein
MPGKAQEAEVGVRIPAAIALCLVWLGVCFAAEPPPGDPLLGSLRSLRSDIERHWVPGHPRGGPKAYRAACLAKLDQLAQAISEPQVRSLLQAADLDPVERHLLQIALVRKQSPRTWDEIEPYYDKLWPARAHVPSPPRARDEHLGPAYLAAWEWTLLLPGHGGDPLMAITAADALAAMGDPDSMELLEAVYKWSIQVDAWHRMRPAMLSALCSYKTPELRVKALHTLTRCWLETKLMAGKKTADGVVFPESMVTKPISTAASVMRAELLAAEAAKATPGSDYAEFLKQAIGFQEKWKKKAE